MHTKIIIIGIYKITSPSGRIYIGQSINIAERWGRYKGLQCKQQEKLYNSFLKYGVESHKFEIIHIMEVYNQEELDTLEENYVLEFECVTKGLNIRFGGGSRGKHSAETKEKLRQINLGKKYSDKTKAKQRKISLANGAKPPVRHREDMSKEHLDKLREGFSGKNNPNYGNKLMTPEHKQRLLEINLGKKITEAQKKWASELGKRNES